MASTNVPLSCENPRKREGRNTGRNVETEDFHIVGFGLGGNLKSIPHLGKVKSAIYVIFQ